MARRAAAALGLLLAASTPARAEPDALAPHPDARWWLSATLDATLAAQPGFHGAAAPGPDSFTTTDHAALTVVPGIHAGYALTATTAVIASGEGAYGDGLSRGSGLGGFVDLDQLHGPGRGAAPYLADAYLEQLLPLAAGSARPPRDAHHLLRLPDRRLVLRAGRFAATDVFDRAREPFQNWSTAHDAAYDHAQDARGYTLGAVLEYVGPLVAVRAGELLMPKTARGEDLEFDVTRARGETLEIELHDCIAGRPGAIRARAYENHVVAGNYAEAVAEYRADIVDQPDVTFTRAVGRTKHGYAADWTQVVTGPLHAFARVGWSDGQTETFAFAEVDNSVAAGVGLVGTWWRRPGDQLALGVASNGLSDAHLTYLALGGIGEVLGDGSLRYGREDVLEVQYAARLLRGVAIAADLQGIEHPGFDRQRGPVGVGLIHLRLAI